MQNPAAVGALYQRLLMEQMMGMAVGGAPEAPAMPASSGVRSLRDGDDAGVFGAFGGIDPVAAARAMAIPTHAGGISTAL